MDAVFQPFDVKLQVLSETGLEESTRIRVKLNGDGTPVGKNINLVDLCFTVLEEKVCMAANRNYPIVLFKGKENYTNLKNVLVCVLGSVEHCNSIVVNEKTFVVEQYLAGDYKFICTVCGLDAPACNYSCIWCKCSKKDRSGFNQEWSISDPALGCRTMQDIQECLKAKVKKRFSVKEEPLFPWIPLTRVVVDPLHLFLRVSDQLFKHIITLVKLQDSIECPTKQPSEKGVNLVRLESYMQAIGVSFCFYVDQKNGSGSTLTAKSLRGPEYIKLHNIIDVQRILPHLPDEKVKKIQYLWN
jgi:hypothetical protein